MYALISGYKKKAQTPIIKLTDHMMLKKKEDQSVDVSVLRKRGNKRLMGARWLDGFERKQGEVGGKDEAG